MKSNTFFAISLMTFFLSACGGGGGGSSSQTTNTPPTTPDDEQPMVYTGVFIDSPVAGLNYQTASESGVTNADGEFTYQLDETVTFSIGGITLPAVAGQALVTPLDVFSTDDVYDTQVISLIRLLQTLDDDNDASNGITIPQAAHLLASNVNTDFTTDSFADLISELELSSSMVTEQDAIYHFQQSLIAAGLVKPSTCGDDHPKVGQSADFQTFSHNVAGTATIIDNCTIEITNFDYDGGGPDVYIYAGNDGEFTDIDSFAISGAINGESFNNASMTLKLPNSKTLNDFDSLSVWCVDFNVDFGSLTF